MPLCAQRTENVAHQHFLGLVNDPVNVVRGSAFYRSDLDTLRIRAGSLELWDGAIWFPLPRPGNGLFSRLNSIRIVEPTLWPGATVPADMDAAISDCIGQTCLVLYPSSLGTGEATSIPENTTVLDLRGAAITPPGSGFEPGLLFRRRVTLDSATNFRNKGILYLDLDADDGGSYNSTSKDGYSLLRGQLDGRTQGEMKALHVNTDMYGIGDGVMLVGKTQCWGGDDNVAGTSQPSCEFAEVKVDQGDTVFTATVSGDPASGATTINYTGEANESALGDRLLINTSRTTTTGTVSSISGGGVGCGIDVTFSGAPDWTTFTPSPVGQYFKINSEDVTIGGTATGYWYRVASVQSATVLRLETGYGQPLNPDGTCPLTTSGAYTLAQGAEIQSFDTTANTLTIEANTYDWAAADNLQSPPSAHTNFRGLNLLLTHQFKTGTSRAINISNTGPLRWEAGMLIEGAPSGDNAFNRGLWITAKVDRAIDLSSATIASAAMVLPNDKVIRWGSGADLQFTTSGSYFLFNRSGRFESASAAVIPLVAKHAASPTTDFFRVLDSNNAIVFDITSAQVLQVRPAFGVGFTLDPTGSNVLLKAAGNNTNVGVDVISKGTGAVRINATASSGTGGLEVWDGAATPKEVLAVTTNGASPLRFEGATDNGVYTTVAVTDPSVARTFTLPNADSVAVQPQTCSGTDKVSAISALGVVTCSTDQTGGAGGGYDSVAADTGTASKTSTESLKFAGTPNEIATAVTTDNTTQDVVTWSLPAQLNLSGKELVGGATPLKLEGATDDNIYWQLTITDPTVATKTTTVPNADTVLPQAYSCSNQFPRTLSGSTGATTCESIADADLPAAVSRDTESPAAGEIAGSLSAGYTINTGAVNSTKLAAANKTLTKSVVIFSPATSDTNLVQLYWPAAVTLQRVACATDTGSVTIQWDERAEATPNTAGTNSLTAALVCDADSQATTSFSDAGIAADVPHNLQIAATSGSPTVVRIHIKAQVN